MVCTPKELLNAAWVLYYDFITPENNYFRPFWFHPDLLLVRWDVPELWREPTHEEMAIHALAYADDWTLHGPPHTASTSNRTVMYSRKLTVKIPVEYYTEAIFQKSACRYWGKYDHTDFRVNRPAPRGIREQVLRGGCALSKYYRNRVHSQGCVWHGAVIP